MTSLRQSIDTLPQPVAAHAAKLREQLPFLRERYGVASLALFGSCVWGEAHEDSDIDVLVEFMPGQTPGLLKYVNLQHYLSDMLGKEVDLVMRDSLKPRIKKQVHQELVEI